LFPINAPGRALRRILEAISTPVSASGRCGTGYPRTVKVRYLRWFRIEYQSFSSDVCTSEGLIFDLNFEAKRFRTKGLHFCSLHAMRHVVSHLPQVRPAVGGSVTSLGERALERGCQPCQLLPTFSYRIGRSGDCYQKATIGRLR